MTEKQYDPVSQTTKETRIDWLYDNLGRLTREIYDLDPTTASDDDFVADYVLDLVGNRLAKSVDRLGSAGLDEATEYVYDANDRLLREQKDDLTAADADSTSFYGYDGTQQTSKTTYDGILTEPAGPKTSETGYAYNLQGRMSQSSVDADGDGEGAAVVTEYAYDADGVRVSQAEDGVETVYLNDPQNPTGYSQVLEEKNAAGEVTKTYTLGHDVIAQQSVALVDGSTVYLLYDGHGSTRALLDAIGQVIHSAGVAQIFRYDAFGVRLDLAAALTSLLYSGEQTDALTGLQYLRARYYDPATGRFNRLDPFAGNLDDPQSLHKYLYCHADGVNGVDPSGEFVGFMAAAGIAAGGFVGYMIGGWEGALLGALAGGGLFGVAGWVAGIEGGLTAFQTAMATIGFTGFGLIGGVGLLYSMTDEWDVSKTTSPRNIAIVTGDLGWKMRGLMMCELTSEYGLSAALNVAGHNSQVFYRPNEQKFITLCNQHDIVVVLTHGAGAPIAAGDYYDRNGRPFAGMLLGGVTTDPADRVDLGTAGSGVTTSVGKEWITANELQGKIV